MRCRHDLELSDCYDCMLEPPNAAQPSKLTGALGSCLACGGSGRERGAQATSGTALTKIIQDWASDCKMGAHWQPALTYLTQRIAQAIEERERAKCAKLADLFYIASGVEGGEFDVAGTVWGPDQLVKAIRQQGEQAAREAQKEADANQIFEKLTSIAKSCEANGHTNRAKMFRAVASEITIALLRHHRWRTIKSHAQAEAERAAAIRAEVTE